MLIRAVVVACTFALALGVTADAHAMRRSFFSGTKQTEERNRLKRGSDTQKQNQKANKVQFKAAEELQRNQQRLPSAKTNVINGIQKIGRYGILKVKQAHAYLSTFRVESIWKKVPGKRGILGILGGTQNNSSHSSLKYAIINNVPGDRSIASHRLFAF